MTAPIAITLPPKGHGAAKAGAVWPIPDGGVVTECTCGLRLAGDTATDAYDALRAHFEWERQKAAVAK